MQSKEKTVLIIDGHNFLYRGYYGVPLSATLPSGVEVNAVYGFFSLLRNATTYLNPEIAVIVFDTETGIQSKLLEFPEYKAQREYEESSIFDQLKIIKRILNKYGMPYIESPIHEADDLVGAYVNLSSKQDNVTYIGSTDNDFMQLLSQNVKIIKSHHNNMRIIGDSDLYSMHSIRPNSYVDFKSLRGDPSDNITGIKGIGDKTASKLISRFNNLEGIYDNFYKLSPRESGLLEGQSEYLYRLRDFLTIKTDISLRETTTFDLPFSPNMVPKHTRKAILETIG